MSDTPGIDRLRRLNNELTRMRERPEPGVAHWMIRISDLLMQMADHAGHGMVSEMVKRKAGE